MKTWLPHVTARLTRPLVVALFLTGCPAAPDGPDGVPRETRSTDGAPSAARVPATGEWRVLELRDAPADFRPGGWSSETVLWGLVRGRPTAFDLASGETRTRPESAWSLEAAPGVVTWRNEFGTWLLRGGDDPVRVAGPEPTSGGYEGSPGVLWSRDGTRALLWWSAEWDAHYEILDIDGSTRPVEARLPGYMGNAARLWLDEARILFETVALAPTGEYLESGWRGDLAILDLRTGEYWLVARTEDRTYLRVAGWYGGQVLVREWNEAGPQGQWFYDPATWERRTAPLPSGRAYAIAAGAAVVLTDPFADTSNALLATGDGAVPLGPLARDAEPAAGGAPRADRSDPRGADAMSASVTRCPRARYGRLCAVKTSPSPARTTPTSGGCDDEMPSGAHGGAR